MTRRQSRHAHQRSADRGEHVAHSASHGLADAESFIATANAATASATLITRARAVLGACGIEGVADGEEPEIGYWLGVAFWGQGYATEAARALIDCAFGDLGYDRLAGGAREQPGLAPGAGEVRLPVDFGRPTASGRWPRPHRSIASGSTAACGVAQELGQSEHGGLARDPEKPAPDLIRGGNRFSERITRQTRTWRGMMTSEKSSCRRTGADHARPFQHPRHRSRGAARR